MVNWLAIRDEFENSDLNLKELAAKHGVSVNTVRSRKAREEWVKYEHPDPTVRPVLTEPVIEPEVVTRVQDLRKQGDIVARPRKDSPWLQFLPDEMLDIMKTMESIDPLDVLYDQIRIQWAIILRAQEIMFVHDQTDIDKFKTTSSMESDSWEVHTSWDKHGKFMSQLSTAQKELRGLIKEFMTLAPVEDERRIRIRNLEANTEFTKERTKLLKGNVKDTSMLEVLISAVEGGQPNG